MGRTQRSVGSRRHCPGCWTLLNTCQQATPTISSWSYILGHIIKMRMIGRITHLAKLRRNHMPVPSLLGRSREGVDGETSASTASIRGSNCKPGSTAHGHVSPAEMAFSVRELRHDKQPLCNLPTLTKLSDTIQKQLTHSRMASHSSQMLLVLS